MDGPEPDLGHGEADVDVELVEQGARADHLEDDVGDRLVGQVDKLGDKLVGGAPMDQVASGSKAVGVVTASRAPGAERLWAPSVASMVLT